MEKKGHSKFHSKFPGSICVPGYLIPLITPGAAPVFPKTWPGPSGRLDGQATMYVGSPPCIWVPHHVFRSKVSGILERKWTLGTSNGTSNAPFSPNKGPIRFHLTIGEYYQNTRLTDGIPYPKPCRYPVQYHCHTLSNSLPNAF